MAFLYCSQYLSTSSGGGTLGGAAVSTFGVAMTNKDPAQQSGVATSIAGTGAIRPMMTIEYENPITLVTNNRLCADAQPYSAMNPLITGNGIPRTVFQVLRTQHQAWCASTAGTITFAGSWGEFWHISTYGTTSLTLRVVILHPEIYLVAVAQLPAEMRYLMVQTR